MDMAVKRVLYFCLPLAGLSAAEAQAETFTLRCTAGYGGQDHIYRFEIQDNLLFKSKVIWLTEHYPPGAERRVDKSLPIERLSARWIEAGYSFPPWARVFTIDRWTRRLVVDFNHPVTSISGSCEREGERW